MGTGKFLLNDATHRCIEVWGLESPFYVSPTARGHIHLVGQLDRVIPMLEDENTDKRS